jgi:anti-anti-sigma regulatory factor
VTDEMFRINESDEKDLAVMQVVSDSLELSHREAFLKACSDLMETDRARLIIDLRGLKRIFSIFVGTIMDVNNTVRGQGRRLTVVASLEVTKLFRTVVGPETLEICQPRPSTRISSRRKSGRIPL